MAQNQLCHRKAIEAAVHSVEKSLEIAPADPHRPAYHVSPSVNWMNDPNGLIFYKGEYHLFYQHNPFSPQWGNIHWAHCKSKDLIHWEQLPIALAPSEDYDKDGCFSGSAVEHEGKLYLFYTGNVFTTPTGLPDDLLQQQCVAVSEDGVNFRKDSANPVIPALRHISVRPTISGTRRYGVMAGNGTWFWERGTVISAKYCYINPMICFIGSLRA